MSVTPNSLELCLDIQIVYAFNMANRSQPDPFDHSRRREYPLIDWCKLNDDSKMLRDVKPAAERGKSEQVNGEREFVAHC